MSTSGAGQRHEPSMHTPWTGFGYTLPHQSAQLMMPSSTQLDGAPPAALLPPAAALLPPASELDPALALNAPPWAGEVRSISFPPHAISHILPKTPPTSHFCIISSKARNGWRVTRWTLAQGSGSALIAQRNVLVGNHQALRGALLARERPQFQGLSCPAKCQAR